MCPDLDFTGVAGELLQIQVSMCLKFVPQGVPDFSAVDLSRAAGLCERELRNLYNFSTSE